MKKPLTPNERARIRARSGLADETIARIARGESVKDASLVRFRRAVKEENIPFDLPKEKARSRAS